MRKICVCSFIIIALLFTACSGKSEPSATPAPEPPASSEPAPGKNVKMTDEARALGITKENYPRIDGSTSTLPLVQEIYRNMFSYESEDEKEYGFPKKASKTIPSYKRLINNEVDLIIVPDPSQEVKDLAAKSNVELKYIPIGAEGLVFVTPKENPISNISVAQVNKIYTDMSITNWSELGGKDGRIVPICRNSDSGSQSQFNNIVLRKNQLIHPAIQTNYVAPDMNGLFEMVESYESFAKGSEKNAFTLGYTLYYYLQLNENVTEFKLKLKTLSVDNIAPTEKTISSKRYPLAINYFAVIRKDTAKDHPARKLAEWLTDDGQWAVAHSGLGALKALK